MHDLNTFPNHLKTIPQSAWLKLFSLLDEMEKTKKFGEMKASETIEPGVSTLPYWVQSKVVGDFVSMAYEMDILPSFDWPDWQEGRDIMNKPNPDFGQLDAVTLCKLLMALIRADRFSDGSLVICFEDGVIQKILRALKTLVIK